MPHANPNPDIDLQQISTRNTFARHVVAGFAAGWPKLADWWQALDDALADLDALAVHLARLDSEVARLSRDLGRARLGRARLDRANLRAAMRAALAAHADGEPDPLWYLRDELNAPQTPSADSRRAK
jgi:hypothetical protein